MGPGVRVSVPRYVVYGLAHPDLEDHGDTRREISMQM